MHDSIKVIEQLIKSGDYPKTLENIELTLKDFDSSHATDLTVELLKIKTKCELELFKDNRYLETLKQISILSNQTNDVLVLVHQLIKENKFEDAVNEYQSLRCSNNFKAFYSKNWKVNQLFTLCENFYQSKSFELLKRELIALLNTIKVNPKVKTRLKSFIEQLFNVDKYAQESSRHCHKPSYLAYSGLTEKPFIELELKEQVNSEVLIEEIRIEVIKILDNYAGHAYVKNRQGVPLGFEHLVDSDDWRSIDVYAGNKTQINGAEQLMTLLNTYFDLARCAPLAPEVMISILEPNTHITPHYGTSNLKHTLHIPIIIPKGDLGLRVGGVLKTWKDGEFLLFDDSFEHEAWNMSTKTRVVLIVDIWHNDLSNEEKQFIAQIMPKIIDWRSSLILEN